MGQGIDEMTKRTLICVAIMVIALVCITVLAFCTMHKPSLSDNMKSIEAFVPRLQSIIGPDPRFDDIEIFPTTAHRGTIEIEGRVESDEALVALKEIVTRANPPRPVKWIVNVQPEQP
jgi:hypothetical protein